VNPATDLCVRLYVAGELVDEAWVDASRPDAGDLMEAASKRQLAQAMRAAEQGKKWMVEAFDPGRPLDKAFMRFGTDAGGMVDPAERPTMADAIEEADALFRKNAR